MSESAPINEHLNKLCVLVEDLKNAGYPFSEEVQVMVALIPMQKLVQEYLA
jgi:hypothetical protein